MDLNKFLAKVADRMAEAPGSTADETPLDAACWFIAVHEAEQILDSITPRELAHHIQNASSFGGPYKTANDVVEWLRDANDAMEPEDTWDWLDGALNHHFGIRRNG